MVRAFQRGRRSGFGRHRPFLENLKRNHRKHPPAGLHLSATEALDAAGTGQAGDRAKPVRRQQPRGQGHRRTVRHRRQNRFLPQGDLPVGRRLLARDVTPQLLALADIKPREEWRALTRQQAGAWNSFIQERVGELAFRRLVEGAFAPDAWPPKKDGTWSPVADGPTMTDEDLDALASEGQR
jgi:hypothetical protein